jgi:protein-L-isoaspartate O-methyltransferase
MATIAITSTNVLTNQQAARFRTWADGLQNKIDAATRPMTQNPTPKRNYQYQRRLHDGRNLERTQRALRALADLHERGTVPPALAALKRKADVARMVEKKTDISKGGYYSCIEADDYADITPAARMLQGMIDSSNAAREERERLQRISVLEAEIQLSTIPGFFKTQPPVINRMIERAHIEDGMRVLEPEAGDGAIADAVRAAHPGALVDTIEVNSRLREILVLKNYRVMAYDFLEFVNFESPYDRIVMNPPFEHQQDLAHVRKAYSLLAPGGILVTIMSPSFEYRSDAKSTDFRAWLESVKGYWEKLPEGSFKASGTGVSTRLLVIKRS